MTDIPNLEYLATLHDIHDKRLKKIKRGINTKLIELEQDYKDYIMRLKKQQIKNINEIFNLRITMDLLFNEYY